MILAVDIRKPQTPNSAAAQFHRVLALITSSRYNTIVPGSVAYHNLLLAQERRTRAGIASSRIYGLRVAGLRKPVTQPQAENRLTHRERPGRPPATAAVPGFCDK